MTGWLALPEAAAGGINHSLYAALNGIAGRSWLLDTLIALPLENNLLKGAVVGACLLFAWHSRGDEREVARRRKLLIVTMIASIAVIATTKALSKSIFIPRPFILAQEAYYLEGERLVRAEPLPHRVPLDERSQAEQQSLERGEIVANDMGSFPSDHAGFYLALAAGIWLASRRAGAVALAWVAVAMLGSRIVMGQHSPLDIAAGGAIGLAILALFQLGFGRWGGRVLDSVADWTVRHSALSTALVFLFAFEAGSKLDNIRDIAIAARDIGRWLVGG